jgi:ribose 5-phosphate isomerase A
LRADDDGQPFRTDQKNLILNAEFGPIANLKELAHRLNLRAGIVEHGLFIELAHDVIVAKDSGIEHLQRKH